MTIKFNPLTGEFDLVGDGGESPLTTKGDIFTYSTVDARLPVGTNGQVLSADSSEATGLKWVASGGAPVDSVFGRTGIVIAQSGDYEASEVTNAFDKIADDTTDLIEGTDKNFVSDAQLVIIGNTSGTNTGDQDLSGLALKSNVLELDNTDVFTPDADYEPSTKKYVDDGFLTLASIYDPQSIVGDSFARANHTGTQAASTISDFDTEVANNSAVTANTAKDTNVSTNLSEGSSTETTVDINSSDGTNATLASASTSRAGLLTKAKWDEIVANTLKTGVTTEISNVVEDTTPQLGGDLDWNSNGKKLVGQTVGGSNGEPVYLSGTNTWSQTDASAAATASNMIGIRISATEVLTHGLYTTTGLTAGSIYYLSETTGAITTTAPSTTGTIVRIIGYALSTTELFVDPDKTWVEIV